MKVRYHHVAWVTTGGDIIEVKGEGTVSFDTVYLNRPHDVRWAVLGCSAGYLLVDMFGALRTVQPYDLGEFDQQLIEPLYHVGESMHFPTIEAATMAALFNT